MGEDGLERVTMRRLADQLDTGPASLYVYVANTQAAWGVDLLLLQATATAAEHGMRKESVDTAQQDDALALALGEASADDHASIVAAGGELLSGAGRARQRWALEVLVNGIAATPAPG